jgi:predicted PurR-regulated permease PerM
VKEIEPPLQRDPWFRVLIILLVIIAATYLLGFAWSLAVQFADIILLFALAWVLAFALEPVTGALERRGRMKRGFAVALVYAWLLVILSIAILIIVPVVAIQISQIGSNLPGYAASAGQWMLSVESWMSSRGIFVDAASLLDYSELARRVEAIGPAVVNQALRLATGIASVMLSMVLVLILSFYMVLDGSRLTNAALRAMPAAWQDDAEYLILSVYRAFGGYIRGQLLQALLYATGTAAVMLAADLGYVAVTAVFVGLVMMIPFIGPVLALVPPIAITALSHPDSLWWVFSLLLLLQQFVLHVFAPKVMGRTVGMHPLLVIASLLAGFKLAGAWGAIFAIPLAGVAVAMVAFYRMTVDERRRHIERGPGNSRLRLSRQVDGAAQASMVDQN